MGYEIPEDHHSSPGYKDVVGGGEPMHVMTLRIPGLKPIIEHVEEELLFARGKFPGNKLMLTALHEEVGEMTKEMLNQFHADNTIPVINERIAKEAIQVICMAVRVLQEGDSAMPYCPPARYQMSNGSVSGK